MLSSADIQLQLTSDDVRIEGHAWDFDKTLTKKHVPEWNLGFEPSVEEVLENLKPEVVNAFRYVWSNKGFNAIITNGSKERVVYYLKAAGLTPEELAKVVIFAANSKILCQGFKKNAMTDLAERWSEVTDVYFYDDKDFFRREVSELSELFKLLNKKLTVIAVKDIPDNHDHLLVAQKKEPAPVVESKKVVPEKKASLKKQSSAPDFKFKTRETPKPKFSFKRTLSKFFTSTTKPPLEKSKSVGISVSGLLL